LPAVAFQRARDHTGIEFTGRDAVVVGDTPEDVACARVCGALGVAVATGRHDVAALQAAGADLVLENLQDLERAARVLCDGAGMRRAL
jgi:phosphoglycolate phosphatase-like HAD superfamily hydrolase